MPRKLSGAGAEFRIMELFYLVLCSAHTRCLIRSNEQVRRVKGE